MHPQRMMLFHRFKHGLVPVPPLLFLGFSVFFYRPFRPRLLPDNELADLIGHWSVSPKLENSNNPKSLREVPECYGVFSSLDSCHFKYVIQDERDYNEVKRIIEKYGISQKKIVLMPQAQNREDLLEKSAWLVELSKTQGCLFSTRLHILLWGDKRGI